MTTPVNPEQKEIVSTPEKDTNDNQLQKILEHKLSDLGKTEVDVIKTMKKKCILNDSQAGLPSISNELIEPNKKITGKIYKYGKEYFNEIRPSVVKRGKTASLNINRHEIFFKDQQGKIFTKDFQGQSSSMNLPYTLPSEPSHKTTRIPTRNSNKLRSRFSTYSMGNQTDQKNNLHRSDIIEKDILASSRPIILEINNYNSRKSKSNVNFYSPNPRKIYHNYLVCNSAQTHYPKILNCFLNRSLLDSSRFCQNILQDKVFRKKIYKVSCSLITQQSAITPKILEKPLENFNNSFVSNKNIIIAGPNIVSFASNSFKGENRVNTSNNLIVLTVAPPPRVSQWPSCSVFGLYDGINGEKCSAFLRDNLHKKILKNKNFPLNIQSAIKEGFIKTDQEFLDNVGQKFNEIGALDKSSSCALMTLIINNIYYIAGLGDSICFLSKNNLKNFDMLSVVHNSSNEGEYKRILTKGGKFMAIKEEGNTKLFITNQNSRLNEVVLPGHSRVTRCFGLVEGKVEKFNGNPKVYDMTPSITKFTMEKEYDFVFMGNKEIFNVMSVWDIQNCVNVALKDCGCYSKDKLDMKNFNYHSVAGKAIDLVIKTAKNRNASGSLSCVIIFLHEIFYVDDLLENKQQCS